MYFLTSELKKKYYSLSNKNVVYLSICRLFACHAFQTFAGYVLHLIISVIYFPNFIFVAYILFSRCLYIYRICLNLNDVQYLDILKFTNNFFNLFHCHHIIKLNIFFLITFQVMLENEFYFEYTRLRKSGHLNTDLYIMDE